MNLTSTSALRISLSPLLVLLALWATPVHAADAEGNDAEAAKRAARIAKLVAVLQDASAKPSDRVGAALQLGDNGRGSTVAAQALSEAIKDPDQQVRSYAAAALVRASRRPSTLTVPIAGAEDFFRTGEALRFGPEVEPALPVLMLALRSSDEFLALTASQALSSLGAGAAKLVPELTEMLQDPKASVRQAAAAVLGQVGSAAKAAVPALAAALKDQVPKVRQEAASALESPGAHRQSGNARPDGCLGRRRCEGAFRCRTRGSRRRPLRCTGRSRGPCADHVSG